MPIFALLEAVQWRRGEKTLITKPACYTFSDLFKEKFKSTKCLTISLFRNPNSEVAWKFIALFDVHYLWNSDLENDSFYFTLWESIEKNKMSIGQWIVTRSETFCQYVLVGISRASIRIVNYLKKLINFGLPQYLKRWSKIMSFNLSKKISIVFVCRDVFISCLIDFKYFKTM